MRKVKLLYSLVAALAIALVLSNFHRFNSYVKDSTAALDEEPIAFKSLETPVEVQVLKRQTLVQTISANGLVKAQKQAEIIPKVTGRIVELNVSEGDFISKDETIFRIEDEAYQIEYLKARERVNKALAEYGVIILGENGASREDSAIDLSDGAFDTENPDEMEALEWLQGGRRKEMLASKAGLTSARLDLRKAELDLKNTDIKATFSGCVAELEIFADGLAKAGEKALTIVDMDNLLIQVGVLETEIAFIDVGAGAQIEIPALPGQKFSGRVKTISPILDPESGTCRVLIEIENRNKKIKPGMYVNIQLVTETILNRLLIPRDALLLRDDRKVTFVYEKGLAKWHYVQTGLENDDYFEVLEGLSENDSLIVSGHFNLAHDAQVVIVTKD